MGKNDLYTLKKDLYESERYTLDVEEDNMSIKSYSIKSLEKLKSR